MTRADQARSGQQLRVDGGRRPVRRDHLDPRHLQRERRRRPTTSRALAGGTVTADVSIFGVGRHVRAVGDVRRTPGPLGHQDAGLAARVRGGRRGRRRAGHHRPSTAPGKHVKAPGKVDAYRWLTFYLAPRTGQLRRVLQPGRRPDLAGAEQRPGSGALRQARQDGKRPAAWRVLHRVTYVSRVLAPVGSGQHRSSRRWPSLDIASNYELIRTLEPFVRGPHRPVPRLRRRRAQRGHHLPPDLLPHIDDILAFLVLYYDVRDAPQLAGPQ